MIFSAFHTQSSLAQTKFMACPFLIIIQAIIPEEAINTESRQGGPKFHNSIIPCGLPREWPQKSL